MSLEVPDLRPLERFYFLYRIVVREHITCTRKALVLQLTLNLNCRQIHVIFMWSTKEINFVMYHGCCCNQIFESVIHVVSLNKQNTTGWKSHQKAEYFWCFSVFQKCYVLSRFYWYFISRVYAWVSLLFEELQAQ